MRFQACGRTDQGRVRPNNEDRFCIAEAPTLFMVADGMGGHAAGEIASQIALDATLDQIRNAEVPTVAPAEPAMSIEVQRLLAAIRMANQVIYQAAQDNRAWRGMGTTIAAAWPLDGQRLLLAHVGDSRIYLIRDHSIRQLTRDHSIVEEQISQGLLSRAEAADSEIKNFITRALGHRQQVEVDVQEIDLATHDLLLLCTDGLTSMLPDESILAIAGDKKNELATRCDKLIECANEAGGHDNIAVVLAELLPDSAA